MASVYVTIGKAGHLSLNHQPVFSGQVRSEVISSSATSASGGIQANTGDIAQIVCATAVYARAGGTVTPATGIYCPPNVPTFLGMVEGTTINVIDV